MQSQEYPLYRLLKPLYADDTLISEGLEIEFTGCPNEHMEPLNEAARQRMKEYLPQISKKDLGDMVFDAMSERPREPSVRFPKHQADVPLMPNLDPEKTAQEKKVLKAREPALEKGRMTPRRVYGTQLDESHGVVRSGGGLE